MDGRKNKNRDEDSEAIVVIRTVATAVTLIVATSIASVVQQQQ